MEFDFPKLNKFEKKMQGLRKKPKFDKYHECIY